MSGLMSLALATSGCDKDDGDGGSGPSTPQGAGTEGDDDDDSNDDNDSAADTEGESATEGHTSDPGSTTENGSDGSDGSACDEQGSARPCNLPDGQQYCDGGLWGACVVPTCELGATTGCVFSEGSDTCVLYDGEPQWQCDVNPFECACEDEGGTTTPLVLSFDGGAPQLTASATAVFDNERTGDCLATDWPTADTPWLALDRDGDGAIVDGRELFGSGTQLGSGMNAAHGFAALRELDGNGDGRVTPVDPRFAELVLWSDHDGDRRGLAGELLPLSAFGVLSIELGYTRASQCDARGNCGVERASFTFVGPGGALSHGEVVDLHLACQ